MLFKTDGTGAGHDWGYFGALLIGAIMPLYVMYGFDTAGSLAEETEDPRRTAPTAVLRALLTAGVMGFLLIGFGTMAVDKDATAGGLASITKDVLGNTWGKVWLWDVIVAIFVCCLAIQAMSIRILFAMARDGNLPFARALASVSAQRRVPVVPALTSGRDRADHPGVQHRQPVGVHDHHLARDHPHVPRVPGRHDPAPAQAAGGLAGQPRGR